MKDKMFDIITTEFEIIDCGFIECAHCGSEGLLVYSEEQDLYL